MSTKKSTKLQKQISLDSDQNEDVSNRRHQRGDDRKKKDGKSQNTIIQQINGFAMTPMNDRLAEQTIEDHKYLLELVENRAAIAYFAVANRNQSLFTALKNFLKEEDKQDEEEEAQDQKKNKGKSKKRLKAGRRPVDSNQRFIETVFKRLISDYDFMSVVMYPELQKRRDFVHDAWLIAKNAENTELKIAISNDPFFYINRQDCLELLKTNDDDMIQHMVKNEIMLHIVADISYKLVKIKGAQVNHNQHTPVQLVDFISVLVMNKREDQFGTGEVIFPNNHIVKFMETHKEFLAPNQAVKIFILSRKFRLALQYLAEYNVDFEIDFFTFAIEANAYEIVFYLRYRFEEQLFKHAIKALDSHVSSYQLTPKFLKAKITLSKSMLPIFNFNAVKQFLAIMEFKIWDHTLENNIFSHTANPLLCMCLLYELLFLISKKFFSLSYTCTQLMDQVKQMIIQYIEAVDEENFLTEVMLEKDYSGRDSLQIAVELEVIDLIQAPKVEAVIKRLWNSDFDTSGSFFEMSTAFQILQTSSTSEQDIENQNRFYRKRDIEGKPQYDSNFMIFQRSMYSRLKGMQYIMIIFVVSSIIYYESAITQSLLMRPTIANINKEMEELAATESEQLIQQLLTTIDGQADGIREQTNQFYTSFEIINILCYLNLMFFLTDLIKMLFLKKIGRKFAFPTIGIMSNLILFATSVFMSYWITTKVTANVHWAGVSEDELFYRKIANFKDNIDFKFEYLFSIMIACLITKLMELILFSSEIGPLVKIVGKMFQDFLNFIILYAILLIMFAIIGNLNFLLELNEYKGIFESLITVLDASIGNYDFTLFDKIEGNSFLVILGNIFVICVVITFNILILNLIIAILANTYNIYDEKSSGLYLSKILNTRDDMSFDENYGALLLTMTPLNVIVLPYVPYAVFQEPSPKLNTSVTILQYLVFILVIYAIFFVGSIIMMPFAYLKALVNKGHKFMKATTMNEKGMAIAQLMLFTVLGIPFLLLGMATDFYYFWKNNFRTNLKKIIIQKIDSSLTNESTRTMKLLTFKYVDLKIKSVYSQDMVKTFRQMYSIKDNIQYLLYGQMIPENGFSQSLVTRKGTNKLRNTRTQNLREYMDKTRQIEDNTKQIEKSKYEIDQFNQIKQCLNNFSFENFQQKMLSIEIIDNCLDELRRERKIEMVLQDEQIEEYIKFDMSGRSDPNEEGLTAFQRQQIIKKQKFRAVLCQKVSILRLGYMLKVLKACHPGKASMLGADAFKQKLMRLQSKDKRKSDFKENNRKSAFESGLLGGSIDSSVAKEDARTAHIINPILDSVNKFIQNCKHEIADIGKRQLQEFEKHFKTFTHRVNDVYGISDTKSKKNNKVNGNEKLDTIEEALKDLERPRDTDDLNNL